MAGVHHCRRFVLASIVAFVFVRSACSCESDAPPIFASASVVVKSDAVPAAAADAAVVFKKSLLFKLIIYSLYRLTKINNKVFEEETSYDHCCKGWKSHCF